MLSAWGQAVGDCKAYGHTCNLSKFEVIIVCTMVRSDKALDQQLLLLISSDLVQVAWPAVYLCCYAYFLILARRQVQTQPWQEHRISNTHTRLQVGISAACAVDSPMWCRAAA